MARMYPPRPRFCTPDSHEEEMFEALSRLPEEYVIIHSWKQTMIENNVIEERQGDFIIYHKDKGIICLEAKASGKYENGIWKYASGKEMEHDGPYNQAANEKYALKTYFEVNGFKDILKRCKLLHAVWFFYASREYIRRLDLSADANENITLTLDSFSNLEQEINRIFSNRIIISGHHEVRTNLSDSDDYTIINRILAPKFNLCSHREIINGSETISFMRLETEQKAILNYIQEAETAVIQGLGGTGKTVLAEEYAKRRSLQNEKVLFLCFNKKLYKKIRDIDLAPYPNIKVYNLDSMVVDYGFALHDYDGLELKLLEMYNDGNFPYKHVVVDEGQDFGIIDSENAHNIEEIEYAKKRVEIIRLLRDIVIEPKDEQKKGTFYIFYDEHQMVQADYLPDYIKKSDCKLTLFKNCRNTVQIAETSVRFLPEIPKIRMKEATINGYQAEMYFENTMEDIINKINEIIDYAKQEICDLGKMVILTCNSAINTILKNEIVCDSNQEYFYRNENGDKVLFTTSTKFKGLEADVVIIVDIDKDVLCNKRQNLYVAASRAKRRLFLVSNMIDEECKDVLAHYNKKPRGNLQNLLKSILNCKI